MPKSSILLFYPFNMYTTFCNATPLAFNCVRLPSPRQPKHRATFCLCLRQKASAQDWYPRPDACRGSAWRTNHHRRRKKKKKKRKGTGGDERSYTTQVWCCSQDLWLGCASGRLHRALPRWIFLRWERRIMSPQSLSKPVAFVCGLVDDGELERSTPCSSCCAAIASRL